MRKLTLVSTVTLSMLLVASGAWCGDYHHEDTLICADCHVMHYSQSHGYNADGTGNSVTIGGDGPYEYLLRNHVNPLCLSCHNNNAWAIDVLGANTTSEVRQAGALNQEGGEGLDATGHTLDSDDVAPGSNPAWSNADGLNCVDCHQQHGHNSLGNAYRNLVGSPGNTAYPGMVVTYAHTTNDLLADVYETGQRLYDISNVFFNEPDQTASAYAAWCKGCHTDFHGAKGGAEVGGATGSEWVRHPNADADIGALTGGHSNLGDFESHTNHVKVMNPNGVWEVTNPDDLDGSTPSCMSCHKAHGNQNSFGLIHMSGEGIVTEEGDDGTQARDLCGQCHVQS